MIGKRIIKVIAFCVCVFICIKTASEIVRPVDPYANGELYDGGIKELCSFYSEPPNSLDVVYIGSSHIYSGISPVEIYKDYGITGYDCTSSSQDSYKAYHYLKEVLKTQRPKVVVYDLMALFIGETRDEISNWSGIENMRFSLNFLETAWHASDNKSDVLSYIFPVIRYHDRWEELNSEDFLNRYESDYAKGQDMRYGDLIATPLTAEQFPQFTELPTEEVIEINNEASENIKKMVDLCKENDIELLFIKTPITGYTYEYGNAMKKFADECGIDLIDYNLMHEDIGLDWTTDFLDIVHLNSNGRSKLSQHIGRYLVDTYKLEAHVDKGWEKDANLYSQACKAKKIQRTYDSDEWFKMINDDNYIICVNGNINCLNEEKRTLLNCNSIEYSEGNSVIYTLIRNSDNLVYSSQNDEIIQEIDKGKFYVGNKGISINGYKHTVSNDKCCVMVYDSVLNQIVDSVCVDMNGKLEKN